jgi:hypothetical protein
MIMLSEDDRVMTLLRARDASRESIFVFASTDTQSATLFLTPDIPQGGLSSQSSVDDSRGSQEKMPTDGE